MSAPQPRGLSSAWRRVAALPEAWGATLLLLAATLCPLFLLWMPRSVDPVDMPGLRLPAHQVEQALEQEAGAAKSSLPAEETARLQLLFLDPGRLEGQRAGQPASAGEPKNDLRSALIGFRKRNGPEAVRALRARALAALQSALELKLPEAQARQVLGTFPAILKKYDATRDGELVAPWFVVRTLYKARWNTIHGIAPTDGLARVELLAYYGWLALEAESAAPHKRMHALARYASLGGPDADEAQGVFHFRAGDLAGAESYLKAAYQRHGSWRIRNYLLAVRALSGDRPR